MYIPRSVSHPNSTFLKKDLTDVNIWYGFGYVQYQFLHVLLSSG